MNSGCLTPFASSVFKERLSDRRRCFCSVHRYKTLRPGSVPDWGAIQSRGQNCKDPDP
jgi:hypothetical protein